MANKKDKDQISPEQSHEIREIEPAVPVQVRRMESARLKESTSSVKVETDTGKVKPAIGV